MTLQGVKEGHTLRRELNSLQKKGGSMPHRKQILASCCATTSTHLGEAEQTHQRKRGYVQVQVVR